MENQRGHTLIELIVTLSILGFALLVTASLGNSVTGGNARRAAETEYEQVYAAVLKSRDAATMSGYSYGTRVVFNENDIYCWDFDPVSGEMVVAQYLKLEQSRITSNFPGREVSFSVSGGANRGGTVTFYRNNRAEKYLVIQVGTGRIYLTDEISNR